ncbi:MAG TPA: YHS domain-containing (seleno)protein [Burkholderiales bacterium]|nr:YHS domain-containing (seleno)protein [Burkholderiales bacterium]
MKKPLQSILAVALLCLAGSAFAQKAPAVALKGTDPVSYFTEGRPAKGARTINYDFDDARYLFSNAKNKELFASSPERYAPQFAGLCATGLSMGMKTEADPGVWKIIDGRLYVFSSSEAREMAEKDPSLIQKSHANWKAGK